MAPTYQLGFAALAKMIPNIVGQPLENEHHNADNGDGLQATTTGLLVWRKADNWTAFTDGYKTWINGPAGLQERLNTERFAWELEPLVMDISSLLPVAPWNEHPTREAAAISLLAVHWDGGPSALPERYDALAYYAMEALYHIARDWGKRDYGYGLMYGEKIDRQGRIWITRPDTDVCWAVTRANEIAYNICVDACEKSPPTQAQLDTLGKRLDVLRRRYGLTRSAVQGHGELTQYGNDTSCPGSDLLALVHGYRLGV